MNFETVNSLSKAMFTIPVALTTARKPCGIWLQFTNKDTGFGAISLTERSCAAPISIGDVELLSAKRDRTSAERERASAKRERAGSYHTRPETQANDFEKV